MGEERGQPKCHVSFLSIFELKFHHKEYWKGYIFAKGGVGYRTVSPNATWGREEV